MEDSFLPYLEQHAVTLRHDSFPEVIEQLAGLVEADASEATLQAHLQAHPYILSQQFAHCHHIFPKVCLGVQYETDFFCLDIPSSGYEWVAVELEAPGKKVITR